MTKIEEVKEKSPKYDLFDFERDEAGALHVTQHGEDALNKIFGSESPAVNEALFLQGYTTLKPSEVENGTRDMRGFLPAIVREIAPRDGIERMLAVQMVTTHIALMRQGGRMANSDQLAQFEAHERAFTITFQLAEVAVSGDLFNRILAAIQRLRAPPVPARPP
jgi:hypothetical protein